jgi:hypothetical protein
MTLQSNINMDVEQKESIRLHEREFGAERLLLESRLLPYFDECASSGHGILKSCISVSALGLSGEFAGRGALCILPIGEEGRLVVRENRRGGAIRFINSRLYSLEGSAFIYSIFAPSKLDLGFDYRPFRELSILSQLFRRGLPVPAPAFALVTPLLRGVLYSGSVATWEIPNAKNLLKLVLANELDRFQKEQGRNLFFEIGCLARRVLEEGVYHADFHLGNILLDENNKLILIDFDKAQYIEPGAGLLHFGNLLLKRWQRSISRHASELGALESIARSEFSRGLSI